jgi:hypothetical protein
VIFEGEGVVGAERGRVMFLSACSVRSGFRTRPWRGAAR